MKRLIFLLLIASQICTAQQVTVKHHYYTTTFDEKARIPVLVSYDLTKDMLACKSPLSRLNKFSADPQLASYTQLAKDYAGAGYDQGHNMSAEDNDCNNTGMQECFYYSNIYPQTPRLNRGVWKALENHERTEAKQYGSIHVWIGSVGVAKYIGHDKVAVPAFCWKIIKANGAYEAYIFPNTSDVTGVPSDFETTIADIEKKSGYQFSPN